MRARPIIFSLVVLFELWLTAGNLYIAARLPSAAYAAISGSPPLVQSLLGTLVGLAGLAMVVGLWVRRVEPSRLTRLLTMAVGVMLVADLWSASGRPQTSVESQAMSAMTTISGVAREQSQQGVLPFDARQLAEAFSNVGPAPFFKAGERLTWVVDVRQGCTGPALDDRGREPGTVIYCLSATRDRAWLAVVSVDGLFGRPFVLTADEPALALPVTEPARKVPEALEPDEDQP
jgi:hypothetical protein